MSQMDLSISFTRMVQDPQSPNSESTNFQHVQNHPPTQFPQQSGHFQFGQNTPTSQFPQNMPPSQFAQSIPPFQYPQDIPHSQFMPNINPFSIPSNFQHYGSPSFQSFQHQGRSSYSVSNFGVAVSGSPPLAQGYPLFGGNMNTSGSESGTPLTGMQERVEVNIQDSNGSSPDEGNRSVHINWSDDENRRLASAWLIHSVGPVKRNGQKGDSYWKNVAAEFNSNTPKGGRRRSAKQYKSHWAIISKPIKHVGGVYSRTRSTWSSDHSDDMLMDKVRDIYKEEAKGNKPFQFEYLWKELKDQPKWCRVEDNGDHSKRAKISESGEHTSSDNLDSQEVDTNRKTRLEGQKLAKLKKRGKGKQQSSNLEDDQLNESITRRSAALKKLAEAQKERARNTKLKAYINLSKTNTSQYDEDALKRHKQVLEALVKELFPESNI